MKFNFILLFLSAAILTFSSCSQSQKQTQSEQTTATETRAMVKVQTVSSQPVEQHVELTATIQAFKSNDIATTIPGRIDNIFVEVGDRVSKGQVLVQMDKTNLIQAKIQLQNAEKELNRIQELYNLGSATEQTLDQVKMQVDVAKESLANLEENTTLVSPISGIVTARNFDPKNIYGGAPAILNVMQISPVKILINISESYFPQIKIGMPVSVKLDVYSDQVFEGKISLIHPTVNAMSRTFTAEVSIQNNDMKLRPGMFARVTVNLGTMERVVVPDLAVIKQMGTNAQFVYEVIDNVAYQRRVTLGQHIGSSYELIDGLSNNAKVVIAGQNKLLNEMPVSIQE